MWRTAWFCAVLLWTAYASAAWLTHDFRAWTAEDARRLEVAMRPVNTPPVAIEGPGVAARDLRALVDDGRNVTLVEFIYTHCETVCLALGSSFQQMQATLAAAAAGDIGAAQVRLLSISFDTARDTPHRLQAYAKRLGADASRWRFVRVPQPQQLQQLLSDFEVVVVPNGRGDFEHNAALLVVDRDGRLLRIFDLSQQQLALDYARHLAAGGQP